MQEYWALILCPINFIFFIDSSSADMMAVMFPIINSVIGEY